MRTLRIVLTALIAPPIFLGALLCATAAVAAWLGRDSTRFDILTHFAPIWLAGGLAALLAALFLRGFERAGFLGLGAVAVLAAGGLILPEVLRSTGPKAPKDAPGQIKVVQFNVWHNNRDMAGVVAWLGREDPDIAILQETTPELRERLRAAGRWRIAGSAMETQILSKAAPVATGLPKDLPQAEGPLTRATFRDSLGTFTVFGAHFAWPTDAEDQQGQERRLAAAIARYPRERTIVTGDLNSTPWSFYRRRWDKEFGLVRRDRALFSWPAMQYRRFRWLGPIAFLPIDHVYAGEDWATVSVTRGPKLGSDHYPVIVILAPRGPS